MQATKRDKSVGLDIGQTSAKALVLARSGKKAVIRRAEIFRGRDEGIRGDDELELFNAVGGWLKDLKLGVPRVFMGMPQFMATTQISDFAPGAKGDELEKMVGFETMQLSGLSDEQFIYDYCKMPAANGRKNPVMIGICREANLNEYCDRAGNASITLDDVAMNGLALANAFFALHPEAIKDDKPQVLLDIGAENTTMTVVVSGQVLYVGGLMAGGQAFTQTLMRELGLSEDEAEKMKLKGDYDWLALAPAPAPQEKPLEVSLPDLDVKEDKDEAVSVQLDAKNDDDMPVIKLGGNDEDGIPTLKLGGNDEEDDIPVIKLDADDDEAPPIKLYTDSETEADVAPLEISVPVEDVPRVESAPEPAPVAPVSDWQRLAKINCFRSFQNEMNNNLEHWQSSEQEPLSTAPIAKIWLSGGGCRLKVLQDFLAQAFACPVEVQGPVVEKGGVPDPEYTIAYGLAMQGIGLSYMPISLAPRWLRWYHEKESKFVFLLCACLILFLAAFGIMGYSYFWLQNANEELEIKKAELAKCLDKIPELDRAQADIAYYQTRMLPFVERGYRAGRFLKTMEELQNALNPGDFCVYLADKESYDEYKEIQEKKKAKEQAEKEQPRGRGGTLFDRRNRGAVQSEPERDDNKTTDVMSIEPLTTMVAIGFTQKQRDPKTKRDVGSFDTMLGIQNRLNRKTSTDAEPDPKAFFAGVDSMPAAEFSGREAEVLEPWFRYLENTTVDQVRSPYVLGTRFNSTHFTLKLPFRELDIRKPASAQSKDKKTKEKKSKEREPEEEL